MDNRTLHKPLSLLLLALCLLSGQSVAETKLKFGIYTSDKPSSMVRQFRPVLDSIASSLSRQRGETVTIHIQVAKSYEEGINDLVTGRVDFARFGPVSYILAKQRNPALSLIAAESKNGEKTYNGVICVHEESSLHDILALKGKRFAFGNEHSTIGRYLSQRYLSENGIGASDLAAYDYLGRHDKVGAAVAAGSYDAGALKESTFNKLKKQGKPLRSLATFPNVTKPWIARDGLDPMLIDQLRNTLLSLDDDEAFQALKKDGFLPADDHDYDVIRLAMKHNPRFFEQ
jgi:phosphonate transport system substrate-binding protein